jgi:hypothetical protein
MERRCGSVLALAVAVLLLSLLSSALYAQGGKDQPKFFVRDKTKDLGEFYEGKDINYVFKVRNNGATELHITNVKPG